MDIGPILVAALDAESDVRLAVMFGSAARRSSHPGSDIDVGLLGPTTPDRLAALTAVMSRAAGRPVDVVDLAAAPPLLRFEIARDGVPLLERSPHLWSDFKARAMVDWWDWAPLARRFATAAANRLRARAGHGAA